MVKSITLKWCAWAALTCPVSALLAQHKHEERINFTILNLHWHSFIIRYTSFQVYTKQENAWNTQDEYQHLNLCYKVYYNFMFLLISWCSLLPVNIDFGTVFSEAFQNLTS